MNIPCARPDGATALAKVNIGPWRSVYRCLVPDSYLAKLDYAQRVERFARPLILVLDALDSASTTTKYFVSVTDDSWCEFVGNLKPDKVNFWRPSGRSFRAIELRAFFLFHGASLPFRVLF